MLYHAYEMTHAAISPMRAAARMSQQVLQNPMNPMADNYGARAMSAALEMFINATRRYGKPEWGIASTVIDGVETPVEIETVWQRPFCNLLHFRRTGPAAAKRADPAVLMISPLSGHYATLLRGTVRAMLPEHDVYVTDWSDARDVSLAHGAFDLDDYTDYLRDICRFLAAEGERPAMMAVCQPGIPALAAASLMAMEKDPARPSSLVLMGSPIDCARNPKQPNDFASRHSLNWFERHVIVRVPWPNRGLMRRVYPGFLQLSGFMAMNVDRHVDAHVDQFRNLVRGDGDSTDAHRAFYDEYLAVMDLSAEFYLQTVDRVFQRRLLAVGDYRYRGALVEPAAIEDIGLMTIEGEKDDITGLGQTEAAHELACNLPAKARLHYVQKEVGHYGVFNGSRWRNQIQPKIRDFIRDKRRAAA
ncbi:polyhydroxyalkanoate depolymerase [soil metagenome]